MDKMDKLDKLDKQKLKFGQIGQNKKFRTSINRSCIKGLDILDKMDNISEKVILKFLIFSSDFYQKKCPKCPKCPNLALGLG